ncbi:MAG: TylF/MycF/NovP-related O-methyltransferase [Alphaproteobacteria bacterium]|nr:TylF/MycF/NovP-related O-methyltransferase [Alphaproteobacteria bacterium]
MKAINRIYNLYSFYIKNIFNLRVLKKIKKEFDIQNLNTTWSNLDFIIQQIPNFNQNFYIVHKNYREIEHQVGRYLSLKLAFQDIEKNKLQGDIIEFGSFQGLGLLFINHILKESKIKRQMFAIDTFEGLPESSTIWQKGQFNNTSLDKIKNNLNNYFTNKEYLNYNIIQGLFSDISVNNILKKQTKNVVFIHFDADLGSSTKDALSVVEEFIMNSNNKFIYFQFDDWGCHQDEVPDAFYLWKEQIQKKIKLDFIKLNSTNLTRLYKIIIN